MRSRTIGDRALRHQCSKGGSGSGGGKGGGGGGASASETTNVTTTKGGQESSADVISGDEAVRKAMNEEWKADLRDLETAVRMTEAESDFRFFAEKFAQVKDLPEEKFRATRLQLIEDGLPVNRTFTTLNEYKGFLKERALKANDKYQALKAKARIKLSDPERSTDNANIISEIRGSIGKKGISTGGVRVDGKLAATFAFSMKPNSLYVEFLAANPSNFIAGRTPIKGGGTAAIKEMVRESIRQGRGGALSLTPLQGAESFYRKLGFKDSSEGMSLSASAAKRLLGE